MSPLAFSELYIPGAGSWSPTALVRDPRWGQVALSLADGSPMIIGGLNNDGWSLKSAEYYDDESRRWSFAGEMQYGRWGHAATALPDGRVVVCGGADSLGRVSRLGRDA